MAQNNLWVVFLKALSTILLISVIIGSGIGYITESWSKGIIVFILTIIAQFSINSIVMSFSARKNKEAEFLATQVLKEASERQLPYDLNCAYCNTLNRVGISFINENSFDCVSCKRPNKVYIQFTTVRVTTPLSPREDNKFIEMDVDVGVSQTTVNQPIKVNEK